MANPTTGYIVKRHGDYVELNYSAIDNLDNFDRGAKDLLDLAKAGHLTKLLLVVGVPYDAVGSNVRIEGLNLAQGFKYFNKVAVCAPDPKQLDYLKRATEALKAMNLINDPDNFKHFAGLAAATAWITTA
jgi:hypothetical protein